VAAAARPARDRPRRGQRDEEDGDHAQQHEQEVPEAQRAAVLSLGACEITGGGELDTRPDATAQQVKQQRNERGTREGEPQWREEAHGSCCRAANA
jgi:hypothetical protein